MTGKVCSGDVVHVAREWIKTPYRHQASVRGVACDCLGLVRGVWRDLYGDEPETPPPYSPMWSEVSREETLILAASRHLHPVRDPQPGDVMIFRMRRGAAAKHCGIMSAPTHMIHAYQGVGRVEESALVPYWLNRMVAAFRFPGV